MWNGFLSATDALLLKTVVKGGLRAAGFLKAEGEGAKSILSKGGELPKEQAQLVAPGAGGLRNGRLNPLGTEKIVETPAWDTFSAASRRADAARHADRIRLLEFTGKHGTPMLPRLRREQSGWPCSMRWLRSLGQPGKRSL